jgi:Methylase involved in ubiquinone/menaquinone biosynthesis
MSENANPEFDQYARSYDGLLEDPIRDSFAQDPLHFHRRKWIVLERLLKRAGVDPKTQRWLDVGCGRGELLDMASGSFARAIGCDPSHGMLVSGARADVFQQPSQVELPFEDNSADLVTAVCVYHHVHGEARSLLTSEIRRVLAPGGLCCIIEHNPWNPVTRAIVKRCPVDVDAELLTAPSGSALLKSAGFERVCADYFLFLPERLFHRMGSVEGMFSSVPLGGQYALLARSTKSAATSGH